MKKKVFSCFFRAVWENVWRLEIGVAGIEFERHTGRTDGRRQINKENYRKLIFKQ